MARLKELLFDSENQTIADIDQRLEKALSRVTSLEGLSESDKRERGELLRKVDQLFERAGTEERFSHSVAVVLDEALRVAEVDNHEQVARAMAPLVVQTIRLELRNSQDELVEVLYPITGRMVKAYVASAMSDLVRQLNRRVEQNGLMLRIRSLVSGKSVAELAIAESQHLKVEEIYLIRRGSGALVARWPAGAAQSNIDVHMSGILSAINDFASHAFQEDGGSLRNFEVDDFQVYLRASPVYLVAAKCRGTAPSGVDGIFDEEFLTLLERIAARDTDGAAAAAPSDLRPLASGVEQRTAAIYANNERAGLAFSPFKVLLFLVAVPLFAGLIWWGYTAMERAQARRTAQTVIDSIAALKGYPTTLDVGYRGHTVRIGGLAPDATIAPQLNSRLRAVLPQASIDAQLAVLPKQQSIDPEPQIARLRAEIAALESETKRRGVAQALERTSRRLAQVGPELDRLSPSIKERGQREVLTNVKLVLERSAREIETYRAVAGGEQRDLATLQSLTAPLHDIAQRVDGAASQIASLIDDTTPVATTSHASTAPSDVAVSAENLEAQAQRLATTAIAVSQALLIRPPPVEPKTLSPREKLTALVADRAIFFANGDDFRDAAAVDKLLDELAGLLAKTDVLLRVAGYTDETGGLNRNNPLAQSRADAVVEALVAKGVPRERLVAVGRANGVNLSNIVGPNSANRRVQFEIGFAGEAVQQ